MGFSVILAFVVGIFIYIKEFKTDFTPENIDKVVPFITVVGLVVVGLVIMYSV